jgi:hypothetical protein
VRVAALLANHPSWEPYAVMPFVRFCAGGGQRWSSLPRQSAYSTTVHAEAIWRMGTKGKAETGDATIDGSDLSVSELTLKFATGECAHK